MVHQRLYGQIPNETQPEDAGSNQKKLMLMLKSWFDERIVEKKEEQKNVENKIGTRHYTKKGKNV